MENSLTLGFSNNGAQLRRKQFGQAGGGVLGQFTDSAGLCLKEVFLCRRIPKESITPKI